MTLDDSVSLVAQASMDLFDLDVPVKNINVYHIDRADHFLRGLNSAYCEQLASQVDAVSKGGPLSSFEERSLFLSDIMAKLSISGGYHSLRLSDTDELAHDISIINQRMHQTPENFESFDISTLNAYLDLESLAHEIGHAVMDHHRLKKPHEVELELEYAACVGTFLGSYRELSTLVKPAELSCFITSFVTDNLKTNLGAAESAENSATGSAVISTTQEYEYDLLQIGLESSAKRESEKSARHVVEIHELEQKLLDASDYEKIQLRKDLKCARLLLEWSDRDAFKAEKDTGMYREKSAEKQANSDRLMRIKKLYQIIQESGKKISEIYPQYMQQTNMALIETEGWAVFYSNKIMNNIVKAKYMRQGLSEADFQTLRIASIVEPSNLELIKYPWISIHHEQTKMWRERTDDYGLGFDMYLSAVKGTGSVDAAKQLAGIPV